MPEPRQFEEGCIAIDIEYLGSDKPSAATPSNSFTTCVNATIVILFDVQCIVA